MREIKFRAWDTERKIYVPCGEIIFKDYGETCFEVSPNCQEYIGDKCHNGEKQYDRFKIEQYTGLKDKNGVEIFEGDIFHCNNVNYVLRFNQVGGAYTVHKITDEKDERFLFHCNDQIEVIGNIHENSELLTPQD